jgi:transposase, IS30 family
MSHSHFKKYDRDEISILLKKGYSHREIAGILGKHHSSVSREIERNKVNDVYDPDKSSHKARTRRKKSKYYGMKINENFGLKKFVEDKMKAFWTPEQIAGALKSLNSGQGVISIPSIYKYLYSVHGQRLCPYLPSRRYQRRKRRKKKTSRVLIRNRVFIDQRPVIINERKRFGDFEGDTLGAVKSDQAKVVGVVERQSLYLQARKVFYLKHTMGGFKKMLNPHHGIVQSLTLDNGVENQRYAELGINTYFCHPYSSWEKGLMENTFQRLRRFIPKGSSLKNYTQDDIQRFVEIMNNTPRKKLGWRTPKEVFLEGCQRAKDDSG